MLNHHGLTLRPASEYDGSTFVGWEVRNNSFYTHKYYRHIGDRWVDFSEKYKYVIVAHTSSRVIIGEEFMRSLNGEFINYYFTDMAECVYAMVKYPTAFDGCEIIDISEFNELMAKVSKYTKDDRYNGWYRYDK